MSDYDQRNRDFSKGMTDAQFAYIEAERRVVELEAENAKLRELLRDTLTTISWCTIDCCPSDSKKRELNARACELGIELNDCE